MPIHTAHLLLGQPWQSERRVTHDGYKNSYSFVMNGKPITLMPLPPQQACEDEVRIRSQCEKRNIEIECEKQKCELEESEKQNVIECKMEVENRKEKEKPQEKKRQKECFDEKKTNEAENEKEKNEKDFEKELKNAKTEEKEIFQEKEKRKTSCNESEVITNSFNPSLSSVVSFLLQEYDDDVFPKEILEGLPPIKGTEHPIDFIIGEPIPNWPACRNNLEGTKEFLVEGYVAKSLSSCVVLILLVPKDGTWRMRVDCLAINDIVVKYQED